MYEHVEKPKESRSRAVANSVVQKKGSVRQSLGFVDNRPSATIQTHLQLKMRNHKQGKDHGDDNWDCGYDKATAQRSEVELN